MTRDREAEVLESLRPVIGTPCPQDGIVTTGLRAVDNFVEYEGENGFLVREPSTYWIARLPCQHEAVLGEPS
jgi:hypothetical protein